MGLVAKDSRFLFGVNFYSGEVFRFDLSNNTKSEVINLSKMALPQNITTDGAKLYISSTYGNSYLKVLLLIGLNSDANMVSFGEPRGMAAMGDAVYIADGNKIVNLK